MLLLIHRSWFPRFCMLQLRFPGLNESHTLLSPSERYRLDVSINGESIPGSKTHTHPRGYQDLLIMESEVGGHQRTPGHDQKHLLVAPRDVRKSLSVFAKTRSAFPAPL